MPGCVDRQCPGRDGSRARAPKTSDQDVRKLLPDLDLTSATRCSILQEESRRGGCPTKQRCKTRIAAMEHMIRLHIERLPEGVYLATSDEVQGLVAQGRTIQETIEIARDVARKLLEAQSGEDVPRLAPARDAFDYPLIVST